MSIAPLQPKSIIAQTVDYPNVITPASIQWQADDTGNQVPVSGEFGDVYFSHADGLAESRHVFIDGNRLTNRLTALTPNQSFTIAELGFGTGLNLLAVWQLWRQLRTNYDHLQTARLHFITTEKHPIALADLRQILALWAERAPELSEVIDSLLNAYPTLTGGCHRLLFNADNLIVDIWLGDATYSLSKLATGSTDSANTANTANSNSIQKPYVDAWFLDGFAPSCNESLWADGLFAQLQRLSGLGTTAATYSCAGVVKRALRNNDFTIQKIKGFGRKREMLTATMRGNQSQPNTSDDNWQIEDKLFKEPCFEHDSSTQNHTIVIGAGVAGLMSAWSLANRNMRVTLLDKVAPLAGASGNPRALLAPKMTPIHHVDEHLHTIGYLYSSRFYRQLNEHLISYQAQNLQTQSLQTQSLQTQSLQTQSLNTALVLEPTGAVDLLLKANIDSSQIKDYPDAMATTLSVAEAQKATGLIFQDLTENLYLPQSGLVNPQALKQIILSHPLISFERLEVTRITEKEHWVEVIGQRNNKSVRQADNVIICAAYESHYLDQRIFDCRKIRGQLSWFTPTAEQLKKLPKLPLKYGGYCTLFTAQTGDAALNAVSEGQTQLLLGASFVRNDIKTDVRADEHQVSRNKLIKAIPELATVIPTDTSHWQARAGVRTQTPDYHPMVGQLNNSKRLWTLTAMGAKGYAFAPICAEFLADMIVGNFAPLSSEMISKLSPNRSRLQTPLE